MRARPVQLRFETKLTSKDYVTREAWRHATISRCPLHPGGGCGISRHGTYARVEPPGALVARFYCRKGHTTFSLLPDHLASRLSSSQDEVEQVVVAAEQAPSQEVAAAKLRPDIGLTSALRWLRRRVVPVRMSLLALVTLLPGQLGSQARLVSVRRTLGTERTLVVLREIGSAHLAALGPPFGFGPRPGAARRKRRPLQHEAGPDPPPTIG